VCRLPDALGGLIDISAVMTDKWTPEEAEAWANVADMEGEVSLLVESNDKLRAENKELRVLLQRIYEWDHMDSAADGPYWRSEIDKALGRA
jgi:regulator of replication initiation timing